ncbi:MAG: sigma-54-dependent Fis family transcriptional regulator [Deltaproteobacteria bacterium]|nr:sigma-54-dependent Fis family transcriptional regulator [Deltaproteobacteria bacterium]
MPTARILAADDEQDMLSLLKRSLEPTLDCIVDTVNSAEEALKRIQAANYDLVIADIRMPQMGGMELLERIATDHPDMTIVMMTAYGRIDLAVESMKRGAYDFITKPLDHDDLILRLSKALERSRLVKENTRLQNECTGGYAFHKMIGKSHKMQQVYETIKMAAKTDLTVLITGESGTGKELTARAVHALSDRSRKQFVPVNCPTVPEQILESELFGYKKGAFTHATRDRKGLFQEADSGTLFLDEIGDISPVIQTKLLRVLQEKEIKPLGDPKPVKVDVRIVASTNRNLTEKIEKKEFREDFYYRLKVLSIHVPPLRDRKEDIPLIAGFLLEKHCEKLNAGPKRLSPELLRMIGEMPWPGNVRELENRIIQGILYSRTDEITPKDFQIQKGEVNKQNKEICSKLSIKNTYKETKAEFLEKFNLSYLDELLSAYEGNVTQAAKSCGLERQALQQILRRYNLSADKYRK